MVSNADVEAGCGDLHAVCRGQHQRPARLRLAYRECDNGGDGRCDVGSDGVRALTGALLVREPKKRSTSDRIWGYEWMSGPGEVSRPLEDVRNGRIDQLRGRRRILDGYLLDEEVSADASAEMEP